MSDVIEISSEALRVQVLPLGATLSGVRLAGKSRNLVLGFADPDDHARIAGFAGHLAGPVANRVRGGLVPIDGQTYQMPLNEAERTTLHSGPEGIHQHLWEVTENTPQLVTLRCALPDGCNGLPGNRIIHARYEVTQSTLRLILSATSDQPTPMNIAAHPYWNLDGHADISAHQLEVAAPHYLPTDPQNLPTGKIAPVKNTPFDFLASRPVPMDPTLDLNFCLSDQMRTQPHHAATLRGQDGTTLRIATTCPGLQVYAGAHLPDLPVTMADCPAIAPYSGIALEPQHWPDAPHHTHFPQITLRPGETYHQITDFELSHD